MTMTPRHRRMVWIALLCLGLGIGTALLLRAFEENMLYYLTPAQVAAGLAPAGRPFRVGGLVVKGSVAREKDGLTAHFVLTDGQADLAVVYRGILPDLFREGQGIVALGARAAHLGAGAEAGAGAPPFIATEVLAKHDEKYMPPEVAESLKASGQGLPGETLALGVAARTARQPGAAPTSPALAVPLGNGTEGRPGAALGDVTRPTTDRLHAGAQPGTSGAAPRAAGAQKESAASGAMGTVVMSPLPGAAGATPGSTR
jgi:cytochrome c-type biogenesis protein CcmE